MSLSSLLTIQAVEKVIFSQTRSWANKSKILSAGLFLKNDKPKLFDGIIKEICHPLDSLFVTSI